MAHFLNLLRKPTDRCCFKTVDVKAHSDKLHLTHEGAVDGCNAEH